MILELVDKTDPILRTPSKRIDFTNPQINTVELYNNLAETMNSFNAYGLAANQIGIGYQAFVMRASPVIGVFNPVLVDTSEETWYDEEGCLSFPGIIVKVKRPVKIKVRYANALGEVDTHIYQGLTARIFLHEMDHVNGKLYTQYASNLELALAIKKANKKLKKNYVIGDLR